MRASKGNALFLILIAVALFAALSYAVTQSGRGGSSVDKEQLLIDTAQVIQTAGSIRATVQRMVLTGTALDDIQFCSTGVTSCQWDTTPTAFWNDLCDDNDASSDTCVFATDGGGALEPELIPSMDSGVGTYQWHFAENASSANFEGVGTATGEIYMMLADLSLDACIELNRGLGLDASNIPNDNNASTGGWSGYSGEPMKCIEYLGASYTFLVALVEQ